MASNISYSCEICGLESLTEEELREHTNVEHVEGQELCPFCQLGSESPDELLLHVNQAHLDFLTPNSEINDFSFIDENTPSEFRQDNACASSSFSRKSGGNVRNINLDPGYGVTVNYGEGSPLRNRLNLKLPDVFVPVQNCPLCNYTNGSPDALEEHINRQHLDLTSPSVTKTGGSVCPICGKIYPCASDVELHINIDHRDVLSPGAASVSNPKTPNKQLCPVCAIVLENNDAAVCHVNSHFAGNSPLQTEQERREFELLQAQYGMDNQGNYRDQSVSNMQRAVYAGEMSVSDYYERTLDLKASESRGIDDGNSVTRAMVPRVKALCNNNISVHTLCCTCVDHYASSYGDGGWGCGYRNAQMLISSLLTHTGYNERLYKLWQDEKPSRSSVPSISRLQRLIEQAWSHGFDIQGSEQLGCRLVNTRKWIGATEVVTLLSFLKIRCQLVDFHRPTGPGGTHPELFKWVLRYFESVSGGEFAPPLYLQHQGHSRTIMGVEVHKEGKIVLLVLDPSHSPQQMAQLGDPESSSAAMRLLRKNEPAMKAKQYQIVVVVGTIDNDQQYQQSKLLRGLRIPQDR